MNFTFWGVVTQIIFGALGLYLFKEGRRQSEVTLFIAGILFMSVPGFMPSDWITWVVGLPIFYWLVSR